MLTDLCQETKNYFVDRNNGITNGKFAIIGGELFTVKNGVYSPFTEIQVGQYVRIVNSTFNDGVWRYPDYSMEDEVFEGAIWRLKIPRAFIALSEEIDKWCADNAAALSSPYQSESFGKYSYSLKSGSGSSGNSSITWQDQFAQKLNKWRKVSVL